MLLGFVFVCFFVCFVGFVFVILLFFLRVFVSVFCEFLWLLLLCYVLFVLGSVFVAVLANFQTHLC